MEKNKKLKLIVLSGLVLLGVGVFLWLYNRSGNTTTVAVDDDSSSFVPFIPIWIAILPAIVANRKKEELSEKQRRLTLAFVIMTGLAVLATVLALLLG